MKLKSPILSNVKKEYLKFLKSQEIKGEIFKNKIKQLNDFYIPLAETIYTKYKSNKKVKIVGLTGGQGVGKSTISNILKIVLKKGFDLNTIIFSIDDFYKTLKERKIMSQKISKLFLTRGVPGTHDTRLLYNTINTLRNKTSKKILIPRLDKSTDERLKKTKWTKVKIKADIIIFEGWCVGVQAQKMKNLIKPINELERIEDKKLVWRRKVNYEIKKNYDKIFNLIDMLIFLKVPSFKYVYEWRSLQEIKLKKKSIGKKIMSKEQIKRFIMFYERITKHMLKTTSRTADILINIDKDHCMQSMKIR